MVSDAAFQGATGRGSATAARAASPAAPVRRATCSSRVPRRVRRIVARLAERVSASHILFERMSWWSRLTGGKADGQSKADRVDYLTEALALERQGDYDAALTSYRLALRDRPNDHRVLQNMAIAYTRTGQLEEAIRSYRKALDVQPTLAGAHYGLAFLLLKRGESDAAAHHLQAFLRQPPQTAEAERWVRHARATLAELRGESPGADAISDGYEGGAGTAPAPRP